MPVIEHVMYEYTRKDGTRHTVRRGDEVSTKGWDTGSVERAEKHGVFRPDVDDTDDEPVDTADMDVQQLAELISDRKLNAKQTVDLAQGDAVLAQKVLDAENIVTGGTPRKSVFDVLAVVVGRGDAA